MMSVKATRFRQRNDTGKENEYICIINNDHDRNWKEYPMWVDCLFNRYLPRYNTLRRRLGVHRYYGKLVEWAYG
jgi:hypothetical protein